jgi:CHAT domain-containing protein/Flp pilus assembly protein TadD
MMNLRRQSTMLLAACQTAVLGLLLVAANLSAAEPADTNAAARQQLAAIAARLAQAVEKNDIEQQEKLLAEAKTAADKWYERVRDDQAASAEDRGAALQAAIERGRASAAFLRDQHRYQDAADAYTQLEQFLTRERGADFWQTVDARHAAREATRTGKLTLTDAISAGAALVSMQQAQQLVQEGRYAQGVKQLEESAATIRNVCGGDSPEYFEFALATAGLHRHAGHFTEAEAAFERAIRLAEQIFGKQHPKYADVQNMFGAMRFAQGRYGEALEIFVRCRDIYTATIGKENSDYALVLNNMAACYNNLNRFQESEPLLLQVVEIQRRTVGEQHARTAMAFNNLGYLYQMWDRLAEAEKAIRRSIEIYEAVAGKSHPDTLDSAAILADLYTQQGKYSEALPIYLRVRDGRKELLGDKHPDYGGSLTSLGFFYRSQGAFAAAEPYLKEALESARHNFGNESPRYAYALANLGSLSWSAGEYPQAVELFQQALAIFDRTSGEDAWYGQTLTNLGAAYVEMGRYVEAEPILRRAADIQERKLGPYHTQLALALGNLSAAAAGLGDAAEEDRLDRRVVEIYRRAYGEKHIDYARALGNLAGNYLARQELAEAADTFNQSLAAYRAAVGESHPEYAFYLAALARTQLQQNQFSAAEQSIRRAQEIQAKNLDETHPQCIGTWADLGLALLLQNRLDEAQAAFERGLALAEKSGACPEEVTTVFHHGLARTFHARGDEAAAERHARQAVDQALAWSEKTMGSQSERRQLALTTSVQRYLNNYLTIALDTGRFADSAYRFAFRRKGSAWVQQRRLRAVADDPAAAPLFTQLQAAASKLAQQAMNPPRPELREVWHKEVEALTRQKESLEAQLASSCEAFRRAQQAVTVEDLQASLPADAALLDFVEYGRVNKPGQAGVDALVESRFAAFIVRPGRPVELFDLGSAESVDVAVDRWRKACWEERHAADGLGPDGLAAGKQLRQQLWEPLEARLEGVKLVLTSPDGALGRFPLGALPGRNAGDFLLEDWHLASVPVPQALPELLQLEAEPIPAHMRNMLLVGGIDYDAGEAVAAAPKKSFGRRLTRGADWKAFDPLSGTVGEVAVIEKTYRELYGADGLTTLEKAAAAEERIVTEAPRHVFLHIATHGFFAPPSLRSTIALSSEVAETIATAAGSSRSAEGAASSFVGLHPGLLSGLALAGVNRPVTADRADGVLTAEEVQTLDLRHVRLVVLSACETGLGEVAGGEGLLGLQRAFQVAGAHTTVTSLWKVDDVQTRALMERFYTNLWNKELPRAEALREAQLWLLRGGMARDARLRPKPGDVAPPVKKLQPHYWAAFILSGDWRQPLQ